MLSIQYLQCERNDKTQRKTYCNEFNLWPDDRNTSYGFVKFVLNLLLSDTMTLLFFCHCYQRFCHYKTSLKISGFHTLAM